MSGMTLVKNEVWGFLAGLLLWSCAPFAEVLKLLHHIATMSISDFPSLCGVNQHWPIKSVECVGPSNIMSCSAIKKLAASFLGLTLQGRPQRLAGRTEVSRLIIGPVDWKGIVCMSGVNLFRRYHSAREGVGTVKVACALGV